MNSDQKIIKILLNQKENITMAKNLEIGMPKRVVCNEYEEESTIKHFYIFPNMQTKPNVSDRFIEVVFDDRTSISIPMNAITAIICTPDDINYPAS